VREDEQQRNADGPQIHASSIFEGSFTVFEEGWMNQRLKYALLVLACALGSDAWAQTGPYPNKPVKLVVPAPAGGPTDVLGRILGQKMAESMGQPIVVENRPGANQIIGTDFVAKSAPDGYTLLMVVDSTMTMHPFAYKKLPYDPFKDFVQITTIANSYVVIMSTSSLPVDSVADLISRAKTQPGTVSVATGTLTTQVIAERFASLAGIKLLHVPYKGSAAVAQAVLAGDVNMAADGVSAYRSNIGKGRFKILATTGTRRPALIADVPTFAELGFPGFEGGVWLGMAAPAGTPMPIVNRLSEEVGRILAMRDVLERFEAFGLEAIPSTPAKTAEFVRSEADKWSKTIRDAGISIE
jgi:tripartite-type tricarboxylate transporter receptor subunit TctC